MSMKFYEVLGVPEGSVIETRTVGSSESGLKYHAGVTCTYDPLSEKDTIALLLGYLEYRHVQDAVSPALQKKFDAIRALLPQATHICIEESERSSGQTRLYTENGFLTNLNYLIDLRLEPNKKYPLSPPENPWRRVERIETAEVTQEAQP